MAASECIGICYGWDLKPNSTSPELAVSYVSHDETKITRMRSYNSEVLRFLAKAKSEIEVIIGVPNAELKNLAKNVDAANEWFDRNVREHIDRVKIQCIAVGDGVPSDAYGFVVPAMKHIHSALRDNGHQNIKVSTAINLDLLNTNFNLPSEASFRNDVMEYIQEIIAFLINRKNKAPLLANVHPYLAIRQSNWDVPFALFDPQNRPIIDEGRLEYTNLFDLLVDAIHRALEKINITGMEIVVSETGWPSSANGAPIPNPNANPESANPENAGTYYKKLIRHVTNFNGTPFKPGQPIQTYLYAMFDENRKSPTTTDKNYGIFTNDGNRKYADVP